MAYTYTALTVEQRHGIIEQRIASLEADHFAHELNKNALTGLPAGREKDAALKSANDAQATIERAIAAAKADRAKVV